MEVKINVQKFLEFINKHPSFKISLSNHGCHIIIPGTEMYKSLCDDFNSSVVTEGKIKPFFVGFSVVTINQQLNILNTNHDFYKLTEIEMKFIIEFCKIKVEENILKNA